MAIKELRQTADFYYDTAEKYLNSGDYVNAIDYFYRSLLLEPFNPWTIADIADCYAEMGLNSRAISWYYKALALDGECDAAYSGLINLLLAFDSQDKAAYYFKLASETAAIDKIMDEFDVDVVFSEEAHVASEPDIPLFSLVKDKKDKKNLAMGKHCLVCGKMNESLEIFERVSEDSKEFSEAAHLSALICIDDGNYEKAIELSDKLLKANPSSSRAYVIKVMVYQRMGDAENLNKSVEKLIDLRDGDLFELMAIAVCLSDIEAYDKAEPFFELATTKLSDGKDVLIPLAQCYHNNKKFEKSHDIAVKLCKIYPDDYGCVWLAYHLYANKDKTVEVTGDIPYADQKQNLSNEIKDVLGKNKSAKKLEKAILNHPDVLEKFNMLFASNDFETMVATAEIFSESAKLCDFLRMVLVRDDAPFYLKQGCLTLMLVNQKHHDFVVFADGVLRFHNPRIPHCTDDVYLDMAYWKTYATFALIGLNLEKNLFSEYRALCKSIGDKGIPTECISEIAVILALRVFMRAFDAEKVADSSRITEFCELFGANEEKSKQILQLLGEKI